MTRLVTVAHGTRHAPGNSVARTITGAAGTRLGMPWIASFVEVATPLYSSLRLPPDEPSVVVPLLLSTGHHVRVDLAGHRPLGPDPLLARAQADRLLAAGVPPRTPVVMVAAGSRDPLATRDLMLAAAYLSTEWGAPVRLAVLAGIGRRVADVLRPGDAVSPYLLAPGHFADRAVRESVAAGASVVADVIGPHPAVVDLVVERAVVQGAARRTA